jgi:hypothetical protein
MCIAIGNRFFSGIVIKSSNSCGHRPQIALLEVRDIERDRPSIRSLSMLCVGTFGNVAILATLLAIPHWGLRTSRISIESALFRDIRVLEHSRHITVIIQYSTIKCYHKKFVYKASVGLQPTFFPRASNLAFRAVTRRIKTSWSQFWFLSLLAAGVTPGGGLLDVIHRGLITFGVNTKLAGEGPL